LQNMTVKSIDNWFPPMVQWLNKNSVQHSLVNNIVFGLGIPYAILAIIGIGLLISNIKNQISKIHFILFWVLAFFVYQSIQVVPTLRYFIFLYPFLAIFAAFGMNFLMDYKVKIKGKQLIYPKIYCYIFIGVSLFILLTWPVMFSSIYFHKHTRVEASEWIYKNLPSNSLILGESWDDSLPLSVLNSYGKQFTSDQLPVFDPDTPEKWQKMNDMLMRSDYYILSSNRGWGSIMTVPKKYPLMSKFYKLLLNDKLQYKKIKEFTSYPKFQILNFKFQIKDSWSDEGFTVYDHPRVLIFKNERHSSKIF